MAAKVSVSIQCTSRNPVLRCRSVKKYAMKTRVFMQTRSIETELDEEFNTRLRNDASNPRTKMVHLPYTAINFAAVMSAVRLKVQTRRALQCGV
jgi:hypothetical protein